VRRPSGITLLSLAAASWAVATVTTKVTLEQLTPVDLLAVEVSVGAGAVWLGAVAAAGWLYFGESWRGHALAFDDIQEVKVSPSVAGRLATFPVEQGARIKEGQLIATLDSGDLDARIRLAKTEIARLKTRVDAEREALRLEIADRRSQAVVRRISYDSEGRRLRGDLEKLVTEQSGDQAEAASFTPQIDRLQPLLEGKLITAERVEELVRRRKVLEGRIAARDDAIRETRKELASWATLEPEKLAELSVETRLLPFELELRSQEAKVAELELDRAKYRVLSPVTGSIHVISTRPGEWCSVGQELAQVVVPRPGCLTAYLTDRQIPVVTVGTRATLRPRDRRPFTVKVEITAPFERGGALEWLLEPVED